MFAIFWEKLQNYIFRSLTLACESMPKIISIVLPITDKQSFKKLKILSILVCFISKIKNSDILNFVSVKYFSKHFLFLKIWNARVNYYGNYGLLNLLFCFTGHNLEKLYNIQRETAVNSLVRTFLWKLVSKVVSGRSFKIFDQVTV